MISARSRASVIVSMANSVRRKILLAVGAFLVSLGFLIWILSERSRREQPSATSTTVEATLAAPVLDAPSPPPPSPTVETQASPEPASPQMENTPPASASTPDIVTSSTPDVVASPVAPSTSSATLLIPVAGVRPEALRDTFREARSEGRVHDAIDIPAARGTPVLAVADGRIVKFFYSEKGGITIYQLSTDERLVYYYAHLERYADGLTEGHFAHRGEVLAYVGDTGNAGPGNYHLHFSVATITDPKRYWTGTNINPYPMLGGTR